MIQLYADEALVYDSRLEKYDLAGLTATTGLNVGGTAEIAMPLGHPAYGLFVGHKTIVTIYRDSVLRFRGRALYPSEDFYGTRTITCEGELCFLRDGISRPYLYQDTPVAVFAAVIGEYNAQVEPFKQFRVGEVTVVDANDYIRLESESAETVLDTVNKLLDRCGGYIVFTTAEDGARVINWHASVGSNNNQVIELGENLLDFASTGANTNLATGLIPYGAADTETNKRLTIESVNDGKDYILAADAQAVRGTIMTTANWDDVTDPANLLRKAQAYLEELKVFITTLELSALDLSYIDKDLDSFAVGDMIRIKSAPHGVDEDFQLTQMTENFLDPSQSTINLGKDIASLTGADVAGDRTGQQQNEATTVLLRSEFVLGLDQVAADLAKTVSSQITQSEYNIRMEVSETYATKTSLTEMEKSLRASISTMAGAIELEVSGGLGGEASIVLSVNGQSQTKKLDLSEVRQAFANDNSEVLVSGGKVTFQSGTFVVNSTNLQIDQNGTITAKNAELSGNLTTESGALKSKLSSGRLFFYYDSVEYGGIASTYWADDANKKGISVRVTEAASFLSFSIDDDGDGGYTPAYIINHGLDPSGYTARHIFYGNARFCNKVWFSNNLAFANNAGVRITDTEGTDVGALRMSPDNVVYLGNANHAMNVYAASVSIEADTTVTGYSYFQKAAYFSTNAVFNNSYGVRLHTTTDETAVMALYMTSENVISLGNVDLPTHLYGSEIVIQGPSRFSTAAYFNRNIIIDNGYGVRIRNANADPVTVLTISDTDLCYVGHTDYQLRLRGSTVVLNSSGAAVTSDQCMKNSIEDLPEAYAALADKLRPVRYKYNDGKSGRFHVGFIAQEVQEALEAAGLTTQDFGGFVDMNGDGEELGLIYTEFIALLCAKINRLEQQLAALSGA